MQAFGSAQRHCSVLAVEGAVRDVWRERQIDNGNRLLQPVAACCLLRRVKLVDFGLLAPPAKERTSYARHDWRPGKRDWLAGIGWPSGSDERPDVR
jgi:hypothetical protein